MKKRKASRAFWLALLLAAGVLIWLAAIYRAEAVEPAEAVEETPLPVQDAPAREKTHVFRPNPKKAAEAARAARLQHYNRIDDCLITYYCTELRPHICGTGKGITASGAPVQAGVSAAVDPSRIPMGSKILVDYGDGVLHEYIAQDVGAWVTGGHIDLAVATHTEALQMGRRRATVYWAEG